MTATTFPAERVEQIPPPALLQTAWAKYPDPISQEGFRAAYIAGAFATAQASDAAIARLEKEHYETCTQWRSQFDWMHGRAMRAEAESARLREALEPFAEIAKGEVYEHFRKTASSTFRITDGNKDRSLTFINAECFDAARAALAGGSKQEVVDRG